MTREQMIDEAVRRTTDSITRGFIDSLLSHYFFSHSDMPGHLLRPIRAEFRRIVAREAIIDLGAFQGLGMAR